MKKNLGLDFGYDHYRSIDQDVVYSQEEVNHVFMKVEQKFKEEGVNFFKYLLDKWGGYAKLVWGKVDEIRKKEFSSYSNKDLIKEFDDLVARYKLFSTSLNLPMAIEPIADREIKGRLEEFFKDMSIVDEYYSILIYPDKETAGTEEVINFYRIASKVKKGEVPLDLKNNKLRSLIRDHLNKYGWINTRGFYGDSWTEEEIFSRLKQIMEEDCEKKYLELRDNVKVNSKRTQEILNQMDADPDLRDLVEITKKFVAFRTDRMDLYNKSGYMVRNLFSEMAKRLNLDLSDFFSLTVDEVRQALLENKDFSSELNERRKGFGFIFYAGTTKVVTGNELEGYKKELREQQGELSENVKGTVAFKGNVRGRVKVVYDKRDLYKVKKGDVLVTSMTIPDYIGAMERAVAFVTDEGGILCHAAIVSREMKKPCIIGTKTATKVLKDNDFVEVDAIKGIVRKIK